MKNFLLFLTALSTSFGVVAQNEHQKTSGLLTPVFIGASRNIYGSINPEQTCLWYDADLKTLLFTCRGNSYEPIGVLATGNDINNFFSGDYGSTWTGKTVLSSDSGRVMHRYPSGVFYNPSGNSDINNAYTVVCGPRVDVNNWISNYHGSAKYDLSDTNVVYLPLYSNELIFEGLSATTDGMFHICGSGFSADYKSASLYAHIGIWNSVTTRPDWSITEINLAGYVFPNPTTGILTMQFGWANSAFSKDGSVGYMCIRGSDNRPTVHPSYSPIIWRTTDGGITWTVLDYFDFGSLPEIQNHILPVHNDPSLYLPSFNEMDMVVDVMGQLHLFATVRGCYSSNPDSLYYVYTSPDDYHCIDLNVFELYLDEGSNWHAVWVDSIVTDDVTPAVSPLTSVAGNVGWTHRLQAARNDEGTDVYVTWTETDYVKWFCQRYNLYPDLKIWGKNIWTYISTPVINATADEPAFTGSVNFHYTSPVIMEDEWRHTIPVTCENLTANGFNADLPPHHYYIKGLDIELLTGTNPLVGKPPLINVSGCVPNPCDGKTSIMIFLPDKENIGISIVSVSGQKIRTIVYGSMEKGMQTLEIDASDLNSGVYFCEIMIGNERFARKMIVQ